MNKGVNNIIKIYSFFDKFISFTILFISLDFSYKIIEFHEINIGRIEIDWIKIIIFAVIFTVLRNDEERIKTGFLKNKKEVRILIWMAIILIVLGAILDLWLNKKINYYYMFLSVLLFELSIILSVIISNIYWLIIKRIKQ